MRLNKLLALTTDLSRRSADDAIAAGRVTINGRVATMGQQAEAGDMLTLDGKTIDTAKAFDEQKTTILFNKPTGYVVSRNGQGSPTIYELLPEEYHNLKPVGRLDKDSSGLLLLTNDGQLTQELTHPSHQKTKVYEIRLDKPLAPLHRQMINDHGIQLSDGLSKLQVDRMQDGDDYAWQITMHEGRNRQIRRTFMALGYAVTKLHRTQFGPYSINSIGIGTYKPL